MASLLGGVGQAAALLLAGDGEVLGSLRLSLLVSGSATLVSLALGIPAGTALALARFPGRGLVVAAVNAGMGLPPVLVGLFVTRLLWLSGPLGRLGVPFPPAAVVGAAR